MVTKNNYIGPWVWADQWNSPTNSIGSIDLRNIPDQSIAGRLGDRPYGLFIIDGTLPSEYTLLGSGDLRDIRSSAAIKSAWLSHTGFEPQGDSVADMLFDQLTVGGDPTYQSEVPPLTATSKGALELWFGGQLIKSERFRYGTHSHTNKVQAILHRNYRIMRASIDAGRMPEGHDRKVLDRNCEKYRLSKTDKSEWGLIVPDELRDGHEGPSPHDTLIQDTFNRSNNNDLGTSSDGDWSWTEYANTTSGNDSTLENSFDILDNKARSLPVATNQDRLARADKDLSSDDHYAQVLMSDISSSNDQIAAATRFENGGGNNDFYFARALQVNDQYLITKYVGGSTTDLASTAQTPANGDTVKIQVNGTNLKSFYNGAEFDSVTDTAISGNLRCGLYVFSGGGEKPVVDDFEAADLGLTSFRNQIMFRREHQPLAPLLQR